MSNLSAFNEDVVVGARVVAGLHCAVSSAVYAASLRLFLRRWASNDQFVLTRLPGLSLFISTMCLLLSIAMNCALLFYPNYPFLVIIFLLPVIYVSVSIPYLMKAFILWFRFGVCEAVIKHRLTLHSAAREQINSMSRNAFIKYAHVVNNKVLYSAILIASVVILLGPIVYVVFLDAQGGFITVYNAAIGVFILVSGSILTVLLSNKYDSWGIKDEIRYTIYVASFGLACFVILFAPRQLSIYFSYTGPYRLSASFVPFLFSSVFAVISYISLGFQNVFSFCKTKRVHKQFSSGTAKLSLLEIHDLLQNAEKFEVLLEDEGFFAIFQQHLIKELSVEGLSFWKVVKNFENLLKGSPSLPNAKELATSIAELYIYEGSQLEINISYESRSNIKQKLEKCSRTDEVLPPDIFHEAKLEILMLLMRDPFSRFSKSQQFREFQGQRAAAVVLSSTIAETVLSGEKAEEKGEKISSTRKSEDGSSNSSEWSFKGFLSPKSRKPSSGSKSSTPKHRKSDPKAVPLMQESFLLEMSIKEDQES